MKFIVHRVNKIELLKNIPIKFGVEIDIRDSGNNLILSHNPFEIGDKFENYLKNYKHQTLILNIKSEGIEYRVLEYLKKYNIIDYFFLDSSFPMIIKLANLGISNIAVRFSEFESIETVIKFRNKVKWVWIDCFTKLPINKKNYKILKNNGFKLCLVSPELQGRVEDIEKYKQYLKKENIVFDAVCTKNDNIVIWE